MGMFDNLEIGGSGTGNSTNTSSNTSSWLSGILEPIVSDFIGGNDGIDYVDSSVAGLTPAQQAALGKLGSGQSITAGTNIAKGGMSLIQEQVGRIEGLLNGGAKSQFVGGVKGLYGAADEFINSQNEAIQSSVYSEMGNNFGSAAQSNMASTSVAGSSAAQNATNSVIASGANKMTQMMADVSSNVLKGAIGATGTAMHGEMGLISSLLGTGGSLASSGAHMAASGVNNQFKAGLFEQYFNQQVINNNRKNDMVNGNMDWVNMAALLNIVLPTAGIDTTTNGSSTSSSHHGGLTI